MITTVLIILVIILIVLAIKDQIDNLIIDWVNIIAIGIFIINLIYLFMIKFHYLNVPDWYGLLIIPFDIILGLALVGLFLILLF